LAFGDQFPDLAHGAGVHEGVVHHEHQFAAGGLLDETLGGFDARCHGLLDQHMLAGGQGIQRQGSMGGDGSGFDDGIDARIGDQIWGAPGGADGRVAFPHGRQAVRIQVADRIDRGSSGFRKTADQVGSPIAAADHANANHSRSPPIPSRSSV
jgi:hypothetical protein